MSSVSFLRRARTVFVCVGMSMVVVACNSDTSNGSSDSTQTDSPTSGSNVNEAPTGDATPAPSGNPDPEPTSTATPTPTATPTSTPTSTPTPTTTPSPKPSVTPSPSPSPKPTSTASVVTTIKNIASASACLQYSWKNRGKAPLGFIQGMALTYARSYCRTEGLAGQMSPATVMSQADTHNDAKDAITHYASIYDSLNMGIDTNGEETLRSLYTLGIGHAMRESSGSYCVGYDTSVSTQTASTAEAGLFQTSYNSMGASAELSKLYAEYKANPSKCFLDVFKQGASCTSRSVVGTGEGATYQQMNKDCPAFATEYAMVVLRVLRAHYGPINRLEAEVIPSCNSMLLQVRNAVDADAKTACAELW